MDKARYVVGVLVVTCLPPGLVWWFLIHPFVDFWRRRGPRVTLAAMGVIGVAGVVGLAMLRDVLLMRDLGTNLVLVVIAACLLIASIAIAIQRRRHLTTRILVGLPELASDGSSGELLTEGIYARVRHPRYVEIAIGTLAYALFSNWLGALIVAVLSLPIIHLIVLLEERELVERFGAAYEEYRARVPRYLPRYSRSKSASSAITS